MASMKARVATAGFGMEVVFPWADDDLSTFIYSLPSSQKVDLRQGRNKVLLRELLRACLGYDAEEIGKRSFRNPAIDFYRQHRTFVVHEIESCGYWRARAASQASVGDLAKRLYHELERAPKRANALTALFMFALWWNHSRYVDRSSP
jgi:hypothetical protein